MTDIGKAQWLLGTRITCSENSYIIKLDQENYIDNIRARRGFTNLSPQATQIETNLQLCALGLQNSKEGSELVDQTRYQHLVGLVMFVVLFTWPNLAFAIGKVSRYCSVLRHTYLWAMVAFLDTWLVLNIFA